MIKEAENMFYIGEDIKNRVAEITFIEEDNIIIDHTYVDDSLRGKGIALKLVNRIIEYARSKNKKVIPICSYAAKVLKLPEYDDIRYNLNK